MAQDPYPCDHPVPIEQEPHHHLIIANEFVRAFAVEIAPRDRTLCHHHAHDYLMCVIGDAEIVSTPRDGQPTTHTYHDGACELSPAGQVHIVENVRETTFRNLLVELLPGLRKLQRGNDPRVVTGNGTVESIFQDERISVWSLEMELDGRAEVCGPVILVTLNADSVRDISWIASGRGLLRPDLERPLQAILFQLGRAEEQPVSVRKRAGEPIRSLRAHAEEPE